ncbi:MAG: undecaprenyl-phosphate glucose phosphotransferase [Cycloclasticus sp.]|nr:undecaprenyl-phosphate glucose phosphotransferase [Cycloclasticus sp.]
MQRQGKIRQYDSKINAISRLVDSSIILLTFIASVDLLEAEWKPLYLPVALLSIVAFNFFAESQDTYRSWRGGKLREEIVAVLFSWLSGIFILIMGGLLFFQTHIYSDEPILYWIVLTPIELVSWHAVVRAILGFLRAKGYNTRAVAIVGVTPLAARLKIAFDRMEWSGYRFAGYYDDRGDQSEGRRLSKESAGDVLHTKQLIEDCKSGKIDTVFITLAMSAEHRIKKLTEALADTTASVYLVPDLFIFNLINSRWVDYQGITAISIYETPFAGLDSILKRLEDIVLSIVILILIAPIMLVVTLLIKLTSPGPVLFKQDRYGADGKRIKVWKFRSMRVEDNGLIINQASKNDERVTSLGRLLRKTSLDELPQFFNALGGSMSIVGPRPHAVAHNEEYRNKIQGYMLRHKVKPGITGLAQIKGFRGETDTLDKMEERVHYDLKYIQTWSIGLDLKIIFLTIFKGFVNKNAY